MASFVKVTTRKDWRLIRPTAASLSGRLDEAQGERADGGRASEKNREMKEEPTMLLIIKENALGTRDVCEIIT
jgi:hypothetical protein